MIEVLQKLVHILAKSSTLPIVRWFRDRYKYPFDMIKHNIQLRPNFLALAAQLVVFHIKNPEPAKS